MSVVTLPRRTAAPPRPLPAPSRPVATHRAVTPRRRALSARWRGATAPRRAAVVVALSLCACLAGSMVVANRQVELHQLQSRLLQLQSAYAERVGQVTNAASPGQIAERAGVLHLAAPVSVTQVPSTSLDAPLPLPKFLGSAPVTSRTLR